MATDAEPLAARPAAPTMPDVEPPPLRPRLLPAGRWATAALLLLMTVALCRSLMLASSQPALLAPDEDYHWHYVNYLAIAHALPHIDSATGTAETTAMAERTGLGLFVQAPFTTFAPPPHGVVGELGRLPGSYRQPVGAGATRNVLHAPGWHAGAAVVSRLWSHSSPVTRLTLMRYYSALLGAAGVFFAWLLAAQVLSRAWQQLTAASLLVLQPIAAFSASTMTNDVLVLLGFTATLAWCAFLLRSPPSPKQGIGLGVVLSVALLAKSTALALVPLVLLTLLLCWRAHPRAARRVLGVLGWTAAVTAVLAGWWYAYVLVDTHTLLGGAAPVGSAPPGGNVRGLDYVPTAIWDWLSFVYPGYWFTYLGYEVRTHDVWYYLPLGAGMVCSAGLLWRIASVRRTLLDPARPELRQLVLLIAAPLLLLGPPLAIDVLNTLRGSGYAQAQARFLVAAFPAVAVLMVVGLRQLTSRVPRLFPIATGVLVVAAAVSYWHAYVVWGLERFYGPMDDHLDRLLERAGWFKPAWVEPIWFEGLFLIAAAASVAALVVTVVASRRDPTV